MDLNQILVEALSQEASDVHIKVGTPPIFRVNGVLKAWNKLRPFDTNDVSKMAFDLMNDWQKERFIKNREVDMGYEVYGLGRFRVNVCQKRGKMRKNRRTKRNGNSSMKKMTAFMKMRKISISLMKLTSRTKTGN